MAKRTKRPNRRPTEDIMFGLRELEQAFKDGVPLEQRFTVRTVSVPAPDRYSPAAVRKLRDQLGMSQAVFAETLGVSRVWVQGWERGIRQPSALARRLMDTIRTNPSKWLETVWAKAG